MVGVGFFGGLWIAAGVNPETEIVKGLWDVVETIEPAMAALRLPLLLSLAFGSTVLALLGAYMFGKWAGIAAVILAFIGGALIASIGVYFLLAAMVLGSFAPSIARSLSR